MKDKKIMWYDNGNTIVNLIIGMILIIIICSQSFVTTHGSSLELFSSIINHNSVYLFILVYFIFSSSNFAVYSASFVTVSSTSGDHPINLYIHVSFPVFSGFSGISTVAPSSYVFVLIILLVIAAIVGVVYTGGKIMFHALDSEGEFDHLIVLGTTVEGRDPSPMLEDRIKAAGKYLEKHPDVICVVSALKKAVRSAQTVGVKDAFSILQPW